MGQYHKIANLDKREFIDPHKLGTGLKAIEQVWSGMTGKAMLVLMVCPTPRGGGDLFGHEVIGRWHGDRVVVVGDYAEEGDFICTRNDETADTIYDRCYSHDAEPSQPKSYYFTDVSEQVGEVLEELLDGKFSGEGWRDFTPNNRE